jgi:hypothetical protein
MKLQDVDKGFLVRATCVTSTLWSAQVLRHFQRTNDISETFPWYGEMSNPFSNFLFQKTVSSSSQLPSLSNIYLLSADVSTLKRRVCYDSYLRWHIFMFSHEIIDRFFLSQHRSSCSLGCDAKDPKWSESRIPYRFLEELQQRFEVSSAVASCCQSQVDKWWCNLYEYARREGMICYCRPEIDILSIYGDILF